MKLTRRAVLRLTGTAAAALALSGCSASGSAILGSNFSAWLQQTFGVSSSGAASSAASSEAMAASPLPTGEQPAASLAALPAYDADPLTGEAKRSNGRIVGVMVNNISNTTRQNAGSAAFPLPTCSLNARWRAASPASARCSTMPIPSRRSARCALAATSFCSF